MNRLALISPLLLLSLSTHAQTLTPLPNGPAASFRGLSVVNDNVAWVSGSKGNVGRTTDGGKTWTWTVVAGKEKTDFRDVEAFSDKTAIVMGIASPGYILKTKDGGQNWSTEYVDTSKDVFMDAMEFADENLGAVIGDPQRGRLYGVVKTGREEPWRRVPDEDAPELKTGEAFFASSGTNIRTDDMHIFMASGGMISRFIYDFEESTELPLAKGGQSTGANSIAVRKIKDSLFHLVVVGGDFTKDTVSTGNCAYSFDTGKTWIIPETPPHGYRSCVEFLDDNRLIACGTSGVDVSEDGGVHWRLISKDSYHVVRKAKNGKMVLLAGGAGRLAILNW